VCQQCGFDAHAFFRRLHALTTEQERLQALMSSPYSVDTARLKRMLLHPKEGDFWEADHIIPVAEGGGESDLANFQTLCVPCHAKKTKAQERRAKEGKRATLAEGTADLRTWFA
jgi:5-methylcytosine-specific restriction endonuclease McrA